MVLPTVRAKLFCAAAALLLAVLTVLSLFAGKYPLSLRALLADDPMQRQVFLTLRCSRTFVAAAGGFALGAAGFVYQTVFQNPLASPDIIGVSSGASAGAAAGILWGASWAGEASRFLLISSAALTTLSSFLGALIAVVFVLILSSCDKSGKKSTIVLAGIAVHSLAQTVLMCLKLTADPERELASIEYWIMGSLNGISGYDIVPNFLVCLLSLTALFFLHRQLLLLSAEEGEARMLGVNTGQMRLIVLILATLTVSCVVSLTGLISFIGLLAPHGARLLTKDNRLHTMLLGGLLGGILLCCADILARTAAPAELPVSIFTSLLGAPFLLFLIFRERRLS